MKVLLIHNSYRSSSPSGEDVVFRDEVKLLRSKGIDVVTYERSNNEISELSSWQAAVSAIWSKKTYAEVSALIKKEKPDIAHFHNIWYLISPSAYAACKDAGVPVVQTLHNFRMFCANGLLLRAGRVCEECVGKLPWRGAAYGCFRSSRLYSSPVAFTEIFHQMKGTWANAVDAYIALTEFGKRKFIQCGLPSEKIYVKPNFLSDPPNLPSSPLHYAVFVGRLSQEKGLDVLMNALQLLAASHPSSLSSSHPLNFKIVGDGPLFEKAKGEGQRAKGHIEFTGRKSHAECMALLSDASFLIMPSVCYENFPMAIREAFACGKPVVASRLGAMAEIVEDGRNGLLFEPGNPDALAGAIKRLWEDEVLCKEMGANARAEFEAKYTADRNFEMLMGIYGKVLAKGTQKANG